jgi:hypothetical protein
MLSQAKKKVLIEFLFSLVSVYRNLNFSILWAENNKGPVNFGCCVAVAKHRIQRRKQILVSNLDPTYSGILT